jgi:hypothetical protein
LAPTTEPVSESPLLTQEDEGRRIVGVGGARQPEAIAAPYAVSSNKGAVITDRCFLSPLA